MTEAKTIIKMKQMEGQTPQEGYENWRNGIIDRAQSHTEIGTYGIAGLIMPPELYLLRYNELPPVKPPAVSREPTKADGITPATKPIDMGLWGARKSNYDKFEAAIQDVKNQIFQSNNVAEEFFSTLRHEHTGFAQVTLLQLMMFVENQHGKLKTIDVDSIFAKRCGPWKPDTETIAELGVRLNVYFRAAELAKTPVAPIHQIALLKQRLCAWKSTDGEILEEISKDFSRRFSAYETTTDADARTFPLALKKMEDGWADMRTTFRSTAEQPAMKGAAAAPFGTANAAAITTPPALQFATLAEFAAAAAQFVGKTAPTGGKYQSDKSSLYCWTHGKGSHSSLECRTDPADRRAGHPTTKQQAAEKTYEVALRAEQQGVPTGSTRVFKPRTTRK